MWAPVVTIVAPASEPVSVAEAKEFLSIESDDFDGLLASFVSAARAHAEAMTGTRFVEQTLELRASSFADLVRLPIGPVSAVTELAYDDSAGDEQALDPGVYELFGAGLQQGVRPVFGGTWPAGALRAGAVRVTVTVGYDAVPEPIKTAILLMTGDLFAFRETAVVGTVAAKIQSSMTVDAMLANHRIWL